MANHLKWEREAIAHEGPLRAYVEKVWGSKAFDSHDRIKQPILNGLSKAKCPRCGHRPCNCPTMSVIKRAQLANDLRTYKKHAKTGGGKYFYEA